MKYWPIVILAAVLAIPTEGLVIYNRFSRRLSAPKPLPLFIDDRLLKPTKQKPRLVRLNGILLATSFLLITLSASIK